MTTRLRAGLPTPMGEISGLAAHPLRPGAFQEDADAPLRVSVALFKDHHLAHETPGGVKFSVPRLLEGRFPIWITTKLDAEILAATSGPHQGG